MQRYSLKYGKLRENPDGAWVTFTDAERLREALEGCVYQYGIIICGNLSSHGMSCLEDAMEALRMDDPCPAPPHLLCDVRGCGRAATTGFPSEQGYRRTCEKHYKAAPAAGDEK